MEKLDGNTEDLEWLVREDFTIGFEPFYLAIKQGNFETVKWFAGHIHARRDCESNVLALRFGHIKIFKWLRTQRFLWSFHDAWVDFARNDPELKATLFELYPKKIAKYSFKAHPVNEDNGEVLILMLSEKFKT